MFPIYRGMNSYPYQRNPMPSSTYYHPNWEPIPTQMKEEPPSSSCTHESWPHNYAYPMPMQCHNCFSHGPRPTYYDFRPPCSHFPAPPPPPAYHHFCGGYPPYPQPSYPMYYTPPPHYSVDLPRYDYDKSAPKDQFHCCGCPNHSCNGKGRNNVKIEEHEPEVESKRGEPVLPSGPNNFSYPIVWVPPGFTMHKEKPRRLVENEVNDQKGYSQMPKRFIESESQDSNESPLGKKSQGSSQENGDPNLGYRWFPFDMNNIKQFMEGRDVRGNHDKEKKSGDEKRTQDVGNKDNQNKQLSYPIIWVPYDKLLKDDSESQGEKTPATISNITPGIIQDGGTTEEGKEGRKTGNGDEKTDTLGAEKTKNVRTIPVKQLDESSPKLTKKEEEHKPLPSTKKPKLPPICLRVDPPKKKNGNGKSRSPSPPGDKKRQEYNVTEREIKVKDVEEKVRHENKIEVSHDVEKNVVQHDNSSKSQDLQTNELGGVEIKEVEHDKSGKLGDVKCGDQEGQYRELREAKESEIESVRMQKPKAMSELEAAVIIQSAYRGYDVRRWEPLKKLKLMAKVREEAMEVKKSIEELDSCEDVKDEKVKTIIGETIMKLLLKLDTIQGLHESIRDVRRSLAKELNLLQEKLDSIVSHSKTSNLDGVANTNDSEVGLNVSSSNQDKASCHNEVCGSECDRSGESSPLNMESPKQAQEELMSRNEEMSIVEEKTMQSHSVAENKVQEAYMSSEQPQDVIETSLATIRPVEEIAMENDLATDNLDQGISQQEVNTTNIEDWEANILSELPLEVVEEDKEEDDKGMRLSETVMESPERIENQEDDILSELPREVVEEDEKDMPLGELLLESPNSIEGREGDIRSELPREAVFEKDVPIAELVTESSDLNSIGEDNIHEIDNLNDNGEKLAETEASENFKEEAITIDNLTNSNIPTVEKEVSKLQESTGDRDVGFSEKENEGEDMKDGEDKSNLEFSSKITSSIIDPDLGENNDITQVKTPDRGEHSTSLNNDNIPEPLVDVQTPEFENRDLSSETLDIEPIVEKSESEQQERQFSEDQNSNTQKEKEVNVEEKLKEENEKLRKLLEGLLKSEKEQQEQISSLSGKVKDMEKKLAKRKKQNTKHPRIAISRSSCRKPTNGSPRHRPMGTAS